VFTSSKDGIQERSVRLEAQLSRLDRLIDWEKRSRQGMEVSLEPMRDLCRRLGSPERAFRAVHLAGSKGKGSTACRVAAGLRAAGARVALYTSPHLERVQERLTLDGVEIDGDRLAAVLERALDAREQALAEGSGAREATWFDVLTAAAFLAIAEARVDWAVIECGLGGRLDSTNVVGGPVQAITSIYLEHTAVLGSTRRAIAGEKAGIIRPGARVVVGALGPGDEAVEVIEAVARERGAACLRVELGTEEGIEARNDRLAGAILAALEEAEPRLVRVRGARVPDAARLPGRAERRAVGEVRVVLDGAHVPESLALLLRDLERDPPGAGRPVVVLGMGLEKDARGLLKALADKADRVLCSTVGAGPYRDANELAGLARELGLRARAVLDPAAALDDAVREAGTDGWVLVTGSLHLVGALRRLTRPSSSIRTPPRC